VVDVVGGVGVVDVGTAVAGAGLVAPDVPTGTGRVAVCAWAEPSSTVSVKAVNVAIFICTPSGYAWAESRGSRRVTPVRAAAATRFSVSASEPCVGQQAAPT
jgi:hypothetical protein